MTIEKYATDLEIGVSSLKMILSGKRKLTVKQALGAARALKLSPAETEHFELLALRQNSDDDWEHTYYTKKLQRQKRELKVQSINVSRRELLQDPFALRVLVYLMELKEARTAFLEQDNSAKFLAREFSTSVEKIEALLSELGRLGIFTAADERNFHVVFDRMNHRQLQKNYLKKLLVEAAQRLDKDYESPTAHFVAYTFRATDADLVNLRRDLKTLMEKYLSAEAAPGADVQIAQANVQIYPVAHLPGLKI